MRPHRQTARQVDDLAGARGYSKVGVELHSDDRIIETAFYERRRTGRGILQETA